MSNLKKTLHGLRLACTIFTLISIGPRSWAACFQADTNGVSADTLQEAIEVLDVPEVLSVPETVLRARLAKLEQTIPLNYNKTVHGFIDYFTFRKPSYTKKVMERIPMFFPLYERVLAQHEIPEELKYLSIVESSLDPKAVSRVGAGGLWQFMPYTGEEYHLYQDEYVDERMDPVKSTDAACRYLKRLYNVFGDWHLALAAYNSGPGTVKRAMRRSGGDSFWTIYDYLPKETRAYVPQFIALTYMMNFANDHGIYAEQPEYPIPCDTIHVNGYLSIERFCQYSGVPLNEIQKMNPSIMTGVLSDQTRNFVLRVPRAHFDHFAANRRSILDSAGRLPSVATNMLLASTESINYGSESGKKRDYFPFTDANEEQARESEPVVAANAIAPQQDVEEVVRRRPKKSVHVVKRGDGLISIADKYGVEVYDLKKWNRLRSNTIQRGQKLVILREPAIPETSTRMASSGKSRSKAESAKSSKAYKPKYHRVQEGDTLWNISQRYSDLTVEELKKINKIKGNSLKLGQRLIVG
ncbi:transglycosylase SLT domain-containing protein [Larkinella insperata]|uniref:Transglycosylase SLT domain-containing protein n=1 Tax=Larkinella insperata TaxID=332158 RepID=A0ABW3Q4P9_9BACT|nr:lytic transglycosylase domain-containing protein [Larkinella insperata]